MSFKNMKFLPKKKTAPKEAVDEKTEQGTKDEKMEDANKEQGKDHEKKDDKVETPPEKSDDKKETNEAKKTEEKSPKPAEEPGKTCGTVEETDGGKPTKAVESTEVKKNGRKSRKIC